MKASSYLWEPITNGVELDGVDIIVFAGWSLLKLLTIAQLSVCVCVGPCCQPPRGGPSNAPQRFNPLWCS